MEKLIQDHPLFKSSRLNSLYSNFDKLKELNPEGYEANIEAWSRLLQELIHNHAFDSQVSFPSQKPNLAQSLSLPIYGKPASLGTILNELVERKILVPYTIYKNYRGPYQEKDQLKLLSAVSWIEWGMRSLSLGSKHSAIDRAGGLTDERYILYDSLSKLGNKCSQLIHEEFDKTGSFTDKLYSGSTLYALLHEKLKISKVDFELVLTYLSRDIGECKVLEKEGHYIRFGDSKTEITEDEIRIINIKSTVYTLDNRRKYLQAKVEQVNEELKKQIKVSDQKNRIRGLIKTRKVFSKSLETCSSSYDELSHILVKINDSSMNINIHQQLMNSVAVMKSLNSKVDIDSIDEIRADIDEEISKASEVEQALVGADDIDVEEEYQQMLEEEARKVSKGENKGNEDRKEENFKDKESNKELLTKLEDLKLDPKQDSVKESSQITKEAQLISE